MALVELHRFYSQIEAELAASWLESEGIETMLFDASTLYAAVATGYRLMVDEADKQAALRLLAEKGA
ncbi:MAG: putative prokaryotic signal transducing protein [Alphaproteobacteria bacterium]|nr:putative prokaryotic signal transducing protein [Alphaproteobacteria bacterium]